MLKSSLFFLSTLLCVGILTLGATNAQEPQMSTGLLCDTADQVKTIITADDQQVSFESINEGQEIHPCVIATIAYELVGKVDTVVNKDGTIDILEVVLVAFSMDGVTFLEAKPLTAFIPVMNTPASPAIQA